MWRRRFAVAALVSLFSAMAAAGALAAPSVVDVRIGEYGDGTRLVLDLTEATTFEVSTLSGPDRLVVDLPPVAWAVGGRSLSIGRAGVVQVRFGQFSRDTSRVVVDLTRPAIVQRTFMLAPRAGGSSVHRLLVDFGAVPVAALPAAEPEPAGAAPVTATPAAEPIARSTGPVALSAEPVARSARPAPGEEEAVPDPEPPVPAALARQTERRAPPPLPRQKPATRVPRLIAIDAGHGGADPGAIAADGVKEKNLVLTFSRELGAALEESGRYRAVMTRDGDRKISLRRRVAIAREADAEAFLSIHADRVDESWVQGVSVYTLSDEASDLETAELAARENRADIVVDVDLSEGYDEDTAKVLISLVQQNTMNCSAALAARLLPELGGVAPLVKRSHRFGNFRVLKAPDIPSVLVELGFLSNDEDLERLRSGSHRRALAGAIERALDRFFGEPC